MTIIYNSVYDIEVWKAELLGHVVGAFASDNQGDIQKSISAWRWSEELPFPNIDDIRINGGCLTFEVEVAGTSVFFSLWYTFGEVRIGVRVPHQLLESGPTDAIEKKMAHAYDGTHCQKITTLSTGKFFDWIFRDQTDGFASFNLGLMATQDRNAMFVVASRLADILVHIYMSTMNILIENGGLRVTFKQSKDFPSFAEKYVQLILEGDLEAFEYWIKSYGRIEKKMPWVDGKTAYIISGGELVLKVPLGDNLQDGGFFKVVSRVERKSAQAVTSNAQ